MSLGLGEAVLLGLIQGLTEWLPVSSSGHLVIVANLTGGQEAPALFDITLHLGTLLVVTAFFRQEVKEVVLAFFRVFRQLRKGRTLAQVIEADPHTSLCLAVLLGMVPTFFLGLAAAIFLESTLRSLTSVGVALILTGGFLLSVRRPPEVRDDGRVKLKDGLLVGFVQGLAIVPGISRSGSTITAGLHLGLQGETAARLSFLLFIPAIIGAGLVGYLQADANDLQMEWMPLLAGTLTAIIVGAATLKLLLLVIKRHVLHYFAPYCLVVGGLTLAWGLGLIG